MSHSTVNAVVGAIRHLDALNRVLLDQLQRGGEAFVSNAIVGGRYVLRACIVNFRTALMDVEAMPEIVARSGRIVDAELRSPFAPQYAAREK